jgi:hypothetical protein
MPLVWAAGCASESFAVAGDGGVDASSDRPGDEASSTPDASPDPRGCELFPAAFLCDDFDHETAFLPRWTTVDISPGTTASIDTFGVSRSSSFRAVLPATAGIHARLGKQFAADPASVKIAFDLHIDTWGVGSGAESSIDLVGIGTTGWELTLYASRGSGGELAIDAYEYGSAGGPFVDTNLPLNRTQDDLLQAGAGWLHCSLEWRKGSPANAVGTIGASAPKSQTLSAQTPFADGGHVTVGASASVGSNSWQLHVDNVVIDVVPAR